MIRVAIMVLIAWALCVPLSLAVMADQGELESIKRRILREPKYESKPRYLLLALGLDAKSRVWVVEDGRKLYVDKNANGDLTDDGPPTTPSNEKGFRRNVDSEAKSWRYDYVLTEFTPSGRQPQKDFQLRRWNHGKPGGDGYGEPDGDSYGLSLKLDGKTPMYAGWTPSWSDSSENASIIHFGGSLTPRTLRFKEFTVGAKMDRLSFGFMNPGLGKGADARLSIDAVAADVVPEVRIRWPKEGETPLETTHRLDQRCCYWEFYTVDFEVPKEATVGTAMATIELPLSALPISLTTSTINVPVVAASADASTTE